MDSTPTPDAPEQPRLPVQRTPRDEALAAASAEYAERAREGDVAALLAPYHG